MPDEMKNIIKAEFVAPIVSYLAHPQCTTSGGLFEASGGAFKQVRWQRSVGLRLDRNQPMPLSAIADGWQAITNFSEAEYPTEMREGLRGLYDESFTLPSK